MLVRSAKFTINGQFGHQKRSLKLRSSVLISIQVGLAQCFKCQSKERPQQGPSSNILKTFAKFFSQPQQRAMSSPPAQGNLALFCLKVIDLGFQECRIIRVTRPDSPNKPAGHWTVSIRSSGHNTILQLQLQLDTVRGVQLIIECCPALKQKDANIYKSAPKIPLEQQIRRIVLVGIIISHANQANRQTVRF